MKKVLLHDKTFCHALLLFFSACFAHFWCRMGCVFIYWALRSSPFGVVYNTRASAHEEEGGRSV
jgi:hypothetical protein